MTEPNLTTYVVSIGRDIGPDTLKSHSHLDALVERHTDAAGIKHWRLNDREWERFCFELRTLCLEETSAVYFFGTGHGVWDGVTEDAYTVVGQVDQDTNDLYVLRRALRTFCLLYGQDAIALTLGTTEFQSAGA